LLGTGDSLGVSSGSLELTGTGSTTVSALQGVLALALSTTVTVDAGVTVLDATGGSITNTGTLLINGTFEEQAGTVATGTGDGPVLLGDGSTLTLAGTGASSFALAEPGTGYDTTVSLAGNVAANQTLDLDAPYAGTATVDVAGSFTNAGTTTLAIDSPSGNGKGVDLVFPESGDTLTNTGTLDLTGSPTGAEDTAQMSIDAGIANQGTLDVGGDSLNGVDFDVTAGTVTNSSTLNVAPTPNAYYGTPTTMDAESGTAFVNAAGGSISNEGTLEADGSFEQETGTVATAAGDVPVVLGDGASLDLSGAGAGDFGMAPPTSGYDTSIGVTGNVSAGQTLEVTAFNNGTSTVNFAGSFTNDGTITLGADSSDGNGDAIDLDLPAPGDTVTNEADGVLDVYGPSTNDETIPQYTLDANLTNEGTADIGGSTYNGPNFIEGAGTLDNTGTIDIAATPNAYYGEPAALTIGTGAIGTNDTGGAITDDGGISVEGTFNADAGTVTMGTGATFASTGTFNEDGTPITGGDVLVGGGDLVLNSPAASAYTVTEGEQVNLTGNIGSAQSITVACIRETTGCSGGGALLVAASGFTNAGTLTLDDDYVAPAEVEAGGTITNTGTITFGWGGDGSYSPGREEIDAPVDNEANATISATQGPQASITGLVTNAGSISNSASTLTLSGGLSNAEGSPGVLSGGAYDVTGTGSQPATLELADVDGTTITELDAALEIGPDSSIENATSLSSDVDLATIDAAGSLTIDAGVTGAPVGSSLTNAGALSLGAGAKLSLSTFTQSSGGTLTVHVAGDPGSGDFGVVDASGAVSLAGTLDIATDSPFQPVAGDDYTPVSGSSLTGDFDLVEGTTAGTASYAVDYTSTAVELDVVSATVELSVKSVTAPSTAKVGGTFDVGWTIENLQGTADAPWSDSVYLSPTPNLSGDQVLLGSVSHTTSLGDDQSYSGSLDTTLPGLEPGTWYVVVVADSRDQTADAERAEAVRASSAVTVSLTTLAAGGKVTGTIPAGGDAYVELVPTVGSNLVVAATFGAADTASMFESFGSIPGPQRYDQAASPAQAAVQTVLVSDAQPSGYFVDLDNPTGKSVGYTLDGTVTTQAIQSVTPTEAAFITSEPVPTVCTTNGVQKSCVKPTTPPPSEPDITATINGLGFTAATTAALVCTGLTGSPTSKTLAATSVTYVDASQIYADFGTAFSPTGTCSVSVKTGTLKATLADAIKLSDVLEPSGDDAQGEAAFEPTVSISAPSINRPDEDSYATISYTNPFPYEIPAPLLQLAASGATVHLPTEVAGDGSYLELLGTSPTGDPGVLAPDGSGSITVVFDSTVAAHQTVELTVSEINNPGVLAGYGNLLAATLPYGAPTVVADYLETQPDQSALGLQSTLDAADEYLSSLGEPTSDATRLLAFEANKLDNFGAMVSNHLNGPFGLGLPGPVDHATVDSSGNVIITEPTDDEVTFALTPTGGYEPPPGETSSLVAGPSGGWTLSQPTGGDSVFDESGDLVSSMDGYGNVTTYSYAGGQLVSSTDPTGDTTTYTYNGDGEIVSVADSATGQTTTYTYDGTDHMASETESGATASLSWNTSANPAFDGTLAQVITAGGTHVDFSYNTLGRLTGITRNGALVDSYAYNPDGSVSSTNGDGETTTEFADDTGNVVRTILPNGEVQSSPVDLDGNPTSTSIGSTTNEYAYDANDALTSVTNALGETESLQYDADGQLSGFTEPSGSHWGIASNLAGSVTGVTAPDGTSSSIAYSASGLLTSYTDRAGKQTTFSYNAGGDPVSMTLPGGATTTFAYDSQDNLTSATSSAGTTTFTYNASNQPLSVSYPNGLSITYTYDSAGRRSSMTTSDGFEVTYQYNAAGELSSIANASDVTLASYTYTADQQLSTATYGNGTSTTYTYDSLGDVATVTNDGPGATPTSHYTYTRNGLGEATSVVDGQGTSTYHYDAAGQLIGATLPGAGTLTFAYNADGDRVTTSDATAGTTHYTSNADDEYTAVGATTDTYDADGNLATSTTGGVTTHYTWDAGGQLAGVSTPSTTTTYTYDATGALIAETTNGTTTDVLTDPITGQLVGQYSSSSTPIDQYAFGDGLASQTAGGATSYYGFDGSGNVASLTAPNGSVADSYAYLPFGSLASSSVSTANPFTFGGQFGLVGDTATGLVRDGIRSYDPVTGRFLSEDPNLGTGANPYEYSANDPIDNIDLTGAEPGNTSDDLNDVYDAARSTLPGAQNPDGKFSNNVAQNAGGSVGLAFNVSGAVYTGLEKAGVQGFSGVNNPTGGFAKVNGAITVTNGLINLGSDYAAYHDKNSTHIDRENAVRNGVIHTLNTFIEATPIVAAIPFSGQALEGTEALIDKWSMRGLTQFFTPTPQPANEIFGPRVTTPSSTRASGDPNDMVGPAGYGAAGWIPGSGPLDYQVDFANEASASAPTQDVKITEALSANVNLATFSLGSFGFADHVVTPPSGLHSYRATIDDTAVSGLDVAVSASLNATARTVTWTFTSIDPATGLPTANAAAGFLPPDTAPPEGEGFVSYVVDPTTGLATGKTISASASVVFDTNAALKTATVVNTIDATAPVAAVKALPSTEPGPFTLKWSGSDAGSGVATYDVYACDDGGALTAVKIDTTATSAVFTGKPGHTYTFFVVATDHAGNVGALNLKQFAYTTVVDGFRLARSTGQVTGFGGLLTYGAAPKGATVVAIANSKDHKGYWLVASNGTVYHFGDAGNYGSTTATKVVGIAPTADGKGYWLVNSSGSVYTHGDAKSYGSVSGKGIVAIAATSDGKGYWLVASNGTVYPKGDAKIFGSATGKLITGIAVDATGKGYWLVASNGTVYRFGDAPLIGSKTGTTIVGIAATQSGKGYWLVTPNGVVYNLGDAPAVGSGTKTVVGIAS
jgi:RHS repeat-associated protein